MKLKCGQIPANRLLTDGTIELVCPSKYTQGRCTFKESEQTHKLTRECLSFNEGKTQ